MNVVARIGRTVAMLAFAGAIAAPALAEDGRPTPTCTSPAARWLSWPASVGAMAEFEFRGHSYRVKVRGLKVGSIGAASFDANGDVYHLRHIRDIDGAYGAADASATAGAGAGAITLHNDKGVVINMTSTTTGLQLTAAPAGVELELE